MSRRLGHLVARFVEMGRPVTSGAADDAYASERLTSSELRLWRLMNPHDRRHAVGVARRFSSSMPSARREEVAAALLHDVGKAATSLGRVGRSIATLLPLTREMVIYRDHERLGARMLAEIGADPRTIELVEGKCDDATARALRNADDSPIERDR